VTLRPDTLAALQAFLAERAAAEEAAAAAEASAASAALATPENWQLSQFWYAEATALTLAREVLAAAADASAERGGAPVTAVCISCPSVHKAALALGPHPPGVTLRVLEYDRRFEVFGAAYGYYDFNDPLGSYPPELTASVDVVICDPPFLNAACLAGFAATVAAMARGGPPRTDAATGARVIPARVLLASGAVLLADAAALLGVRPTRTAVAHAAGRLSNPFTLYSNYMVEARLGGYDEEAERAAGVGAGAGARGGGGAAGGGAGGGGGGSA
jgi:uncharacterized membrane protein YgcG